MSGNISTQKQQKQQKQYQDYVKKITPVHSLGLNMCKAFFTGGIICITCICSFNIDGSPGTERIFVIVAVVCGTFKICHKSVLLIIMILPETVSLPECAPCLIVSTAIKPDRFRCCIVCPKEEKIILKKIHNNIKKQLTNSRHHGILLKYVAKRKQSSLSPQR